MNATLTDDRVESMRSTVMNTVDSDIRRRGTRTRRVAGMAAASVLVVGIGSVGIAALDNSGNAQDVTASTAAAKPKTFYSGTGQAGGGIAEQAAPTGDEAASREIITTGSVSVKVNDPREAAQKVSAYVDSIGGRVDARNETVGDDFEAAYLEVRVPSTKVTQAIAQLKTYGTVTDVSLQNSDVTTQVKDLDARIKALNVSIKRLEKIMAETDSSDELIKAETALTQRQEQLESMSTQRASIADQVQLSTLSIELIEKNKADSVSAGGFKGGVIDGWNALVNTLNNTVEFIGMALPWAGIAIVLYGAYRLIARRRDWN